MVKALVDEMLMAKALTVEALVVEVSGMASTVRHDKALMEAISSG